MKRLIFIFLIFNILIWNSFCQERKPNPKLEQIIFVFKTHFDIGYTDLAERIVQKYSTSMINEKTGKDYVRTGTGYGMGEYLYERFGKENTDKYAKDYIKGGWDWAPAELGRINLSDDPYRSATGTAPKIRIEKAGKSISLYLSYSQNVKMPHDYSIRYRLVAGRPYLEVNWSINGKPADPWPEGGWLCFPLNIDNPKFRMGRTGGISDPATDFVKGSNFDYCFVQEGLAILDKNNRGIGLYSPDLPGISLDRPGLWKYSKDFVPSKANVFFNLYNNQWSTNFTEWIEGSWNAGVYLWFIDNYDAEKSLITPALEQRHPLVATVGSGKAGKLTITLPAGTRFAAAVPCNLRGTKAGPGIPVTDHKIEISYKAYQPISLILN